MNGETRANGNGKHDKVVRLVYNSGRNELSLIYPNGKKKTYRFNDRRAVLTDSAGREIFSHSFTHPYYGRAFNPIEKPENGKTDYTGPTREGIRNGKFSRRMRKGLFVR
jgi:hypothetical protein